MAKIGYLYLHDGQWKDQQIISSEWVHQATRRHADVPSGEGCGYGWWVLSEDLSGMYEARGRGGQSMYEARGRGGQSITVWPQHDLVVVFTGGGFDRGVLAPLLRSALAPDPVLPENQHAYDRLRAKKAQAMTSPPPVPAAPLPATHAGSQGRGVSWRTISSE